MGSPLEPCLGERLEVVEAEVAELDEDTLKSNLEDLLLQYSTLRARACAAGS